MDATIFPKPTDIGSPDGFTCFCCFALAASVKEKGPSDLAHLDWLHGRKGVYLVAEGATELYIGNSARDSEDRDPRKRIAQHFWDKDSGGALLKNGKRIRPDSDFPQFPARMRCCRLQVISFGGNARRQRVLRLERLLTGLFGSRYRDVPWRTSSPECPRTTQRSCGRAEHSDLGQERKREPDQAGDMKIRMHHATRNTHPQGPSCLQSSPPGRPVRRDIDVADRSAKQSRAARQLVRSEAILAASIL